MPPAKRCSICAAGPFTVRPPMSGLTATEGTRRDSIALRIPSTARIGPMLRIRVARRDRDQVGVLERLQTPGARRLRLAPS